MQEFIILCQEFVALRSNPSFHSIFFSKFLQGRPVVQSTQRLINNIKFTSFNVVLEIEWVSFFWIIFQDLTTLIVLIFPFEIFWVFKVTLA